MPKPSKNKIAENKTIEIGTLYEQELEALNGNLRRQAARSIFFKLHPQNRTSVEAFLAQLKQHKDVWQEVSQMGILDFAHGILGNRHKDVQGKSTEFKTGAKRTRLRDKQKDFLKESILHVLAASMGGQNRQEIAQLLDVGVIKQQGIQPSELHNKLRQPLAELVAEEKIFSTGAKRAMKYNLAGAAGTTKKKQEK